jgi:hypothetical protein
MTTLRQSDGSPKPYGQGAGLRKCQFHDKLFHPPLHQDSLVYGVDILPLHISLAQVGNAVPVTSGSLFAELRMGSEFGFCLCAPNL